MSRRILRLMMTPPAFDTTSLDALKRSLALMTAYVKALMFIHHTFGRVPKWMMACANVIDRRLCWVEDLMLECMPPSPALDRVRELRAERDAEEELETRRAKLADSNALPHSTPGVTAEAPLRASGRPSRNSAPREKCKIAHNRAPNSHPTASLKVIPRARPPPVRPRLPEPQRRTSPACTVARIAAHP